MNDNRSLYYMYIVAFLCKEEGKDRESISQVPHLTKDTPWKSDKNTRKHHINLLSFWYRVRCLPVRLLLIFLFSTFVGGVLFLYHVWYMCCLIFVTRTFYFILFDFVFEYVLKLLFLLMSLFTLF